MRYFSRSYFSLEKTGKDVIATSLEPKEGKRVLNTLVRVDFIDAQRNIDDYEAASRGNLEIFVLIIALLANRLNLNSKNRSKPPSTDPNREKPSEKKKGNKPGGQNGHPGKTLEKVKTPDKVKVTRVDRSKLPPGEYTEVGMKLDNLLREKLNGSSLVHADETGINVKGKRYWLHCAMIIGSHITNMIAPMRYAMLTIYGN